MFGVRHVSLATFFTASLALTSASAFGQDVISAKSGLVHYVEGDVLIDGQPVADHNGTFSEVKKDGELSTTQGRAEVLLTPGVFLRVGENTSIRMRQTALDDTKVEFVSGKSMLEADTPMKDNRVTILYKDYAVTPVDHGLYEFTSEPATLAVYSGEADVTAGGQTVRVKAGKKLFFSAALAQERFNDKDGDSLYRWSKLRSEYVSVANVSAARQAQSSGAYSGNYDGLGNGAGYGNWFYNPFYNMYTFLPFSGMAFSPFGFGFYSPYAFGQYYNPYGYGSAYYPAATSSSGSASKSGAGNGGWTRSFNHPVHPTSGAVLASTHASSSSSSSGQGFSSRGTPALSSGTGTSSSRNIGFGSGSSSGGSMGHAGGAAAGGGGGRGK